MINFPMPYKNEIMSSAFARYSIRSGNMRIIHTLEDLFGTRNAVAVMELPTKLDALISNMPVGTKYTAEYFIYKHSLFPYYAAFIPKERADQIIESMRIGQGAVSYNRIGLLTSSIVTNKYYKFCPECIKACMEQYGEIYWNRVHQAVGVLVCPKHQVSLYNSNVLVRGYNRQKFHPALIENCIINEVITYPAGIMEKLILLADDIDNILSSKYEFKNLLWFKNKYRTKLIERGYAKLNNMIHQKRLASDILDFYGDDFLKLVQCKIPTKGECKWISDLVRENNKTSHPIRHLLMARFLDISVYDLFNVKDDIDDSDISIASGVEREAISVDSKCEAYCKSNKDMYSELWEKELRELAHKELSLRQIAKELHSTPNTLKKHIKRMGIKPYWKDRGGRRYGNVKYIDTQDFKDKQKVSREKWLNLKIEYPNKSKNELIHIDVTLGTWLTRYDKSWLTNNSPTIKSGYKPVDWDKRDKNLLPKVKQVVNKIKRDKTKRICWTTIGSMLGISGWLSKKKGKLPLTRNYIESVEESISEFQIRKIKMAIEILENNGSSITYWNLLETAGVKPRYLSVIMDEVKQILIDNGYGEEFLYLDK